MFNQGLLSFGGGSEQLIALYIAMLIVVAAFLNIGQVFIAALLSGCVGFLYRRSAFTPLMLLVPFLVLQTAGPHPAGVGMLSRELVLMYVPLVNACIVVIGFSIGAWVTPIPMNAWRLRRL